MPVAPEFEQLQELDAETQQAWSSYVERLRELTGAEYERIEDESWDELQTELRRLEGAYPILDGQRLATARGWSGQLDFDRASGEKLHRHSEFHVKCQGQFIKAARRGFQVGAKPFEGKSETLVLQTIPGPCSHSSFQP